MKSLVQTDQEMGQIQSKWFPSEELNKDFLFLLHIYSSAVRAAELTAMC